MAMSPSDSGGVLVSPDGEGRTFGNSLRLTVSGVSSCSVAYMSGAIGQNISLSKLVFNIGTGADCGAGLAGQCAPRGRSAL